MLRSKYLLPALLFTVLTACDSKTSENKQPGNATQTPAKSNAPEEFIVESFNLKPGAAGYIRVGMPSDSLKKLVPAVNIKETMREQEGLRYKVYGIQNAKAGNQLLMLAEESCEEKTCKIFRLRIISPKFSTKEGIRVGSTFGEVKKAYKFSYVGIGEADFVALSDAQRMAFSLDISHFPPKPLYKIKEADVPDSARVTSMLMY